MLNSHIRFLDIDDLIILSSILSPDYNLSDVASDLGLTPPAISHRLKKYRTYIPDFSLTTSKKKKGQYYELTSETREFCLKAKQALTTLLTYDRVA